MRLSQLLLAHATLVSAAAIDRDADSHKSRRNVFGTGVNDIGDPESDVWHDNAIQPRDVLRESTEGSELVERAIDQTYQLYTEGSPTSHDHTCIVLRALEWLAYNLIDETDKISAECGSHIYNEPARQTGHLAVVLRGLMIWTEQLEFLKDHLEGARNWGLDSQLAAGKCYLDYTFQTTAWLKSMEAQACDFSQSNAARCLTFDKIQALYLANSHVAALLHGDDSSISELVNGYFPKDLDTFWTSQDEKPKPGSSIGAYIRRNDLSLNPKFGQFQETQKVWTCSDSWDQGPCNQCTNPNQDGGNDDGCKKKKKKCKKPSRKPCKKPSKKPCRKCPSKSSDDAQVDDAPIKAATDATAAIVAPSATLPIDDSADTLPTVASTTIALARVSISTAEVPTPATSTVEILKVESPAVETVTVVVSTVATPLVETPIIESAVVDSPTVVTPDVKYQVVEAPIATPVLAGPVDVLLNQTPDKEGPTAEESVTNEPAQETPVLAAPIDGQRLKSFSDDAAPAVSSLNQTLANGTEPAPVQDSAPEVLVLKSFSDHSPRN